MTQHDDRATPKDFSRIGFGLFAGLVGGAAIGGFGFYSPVPGAIAGAILGLALALVLDWRARRR